MEEQKKLRVAVYARVSSKKEEQDTSLESQKIYYKKFCQQHENWEFNAEENIYADKFTGTKLLRPNFKKLLKDLGVELIETGKKFSVELLDYPSKYDLVIVKNTSRLARNLDVHSLISKLKIKGVGIFFENINKSTLDNNDKLVIDVMLSMDAEYSESLSRKMKLAYGQAIEERHSLFGEAHWGYMRTGKKKEAILKPKSEEYANIIKQMYNMYHNEKMGFQRIATWLKKNTEFRSDEQNADGTYKFLSPTGVKFILLNSKNCGYLSLPIRQPEDFNQIGTVRRTMDNFELIKSDNIIPCVSKELYDLVFQDIKNHPVAEKFRGRNRPYSKYGKYLICNYCGCHLTRTLDGRNAMVYVCAERKKGGSKVCNLPIVSEKYVDECIQNYSLKFKALIEDRKEFAISYLNLKKYNILYDFANTDNTEKIKKCKSDISEIDSDINKLMRDFKNLNPTVLTNFVNEKQAEKEELQNELNKMENSVLNLIQKVEEVHKKIKEIKEIPLKEVYTEEEIIKNLSLIYVLYKQEDDEIPVFEDIREKKIKRFAQNNATLVIKTKLEIELEALGYEEDSWKKDFTGTDTEQLDSMYASLL